MRPLIRIAPIAFALAAALQAQFHLPGAGSSNSDSTPAPAPTPTTKAKPAAPVTTSPPVKPAITPATPRFDCYIFALAPVPAGRGVRFLVQGLRPQNVEGASLESCGPVKKPSKAVISIVLPLMLNENAVRGEWQTHGSCTGLRAADYFTDIRHARALVQIPVQLTSLDGPVTETHEQIEEQFAGANPGFPEGAFRAACAHGKLTEVQVCFDALLKPRPCLATVSECPSRELTIGLPH